MEGEGGRRQAKVINQKIKHVYTKTVRRQVGQADTRPAANRNDMGRWRKEGGRNEGRRRKRSKRKLEGGVRDADAPLHILTFRSLCTMSCW